MSTIEQGGDLYRETREGIWGTTPEEREGAEEDTLVMPALPVEEGQETFGWDDLERGSDWEDFPEGEWGETPEG